MLYFSYVTYALLAQTMILVTYIAGAYDAMYSGLLVKLSMECFLLGTCVSWSP